MVVFLVASSMVGLQQLNWNGPKVYTFKGKSHGHSYSVRFEQANFQLRGRQLCWVEYVTLNSYRKYRPGSKPRNPAISGFYPGFVSGGKVYRLFFSDGSDREEAREPVSKTVDKKSELVDVSLTVDGKSRFIPRRLYWDLLDPDLSERNCRVGVSTDGRVATVKLAGSDGAGTYVAQWTLKSGATPSRKMLDAETEMAKWGSS